MAKNWEDKKYKILTPFRWYSFITIAQLILNYVQYSQFIYPMILVQYYDEYE